MKNKKTFVGIALLMVVLVLGIAYAAITGSLTITGTATATANADNFKVVFNGEKTADEGVTATITGDTTATMNVTGLTKTGDKKTATFTIENQSEELNALIAVKANTVTTNNAEFFSVTAKVDDSATLEPDGTTTVKVTVELVKTPVTDVTGSINVELTATAQVAGN